MRWGLALGVLVCASTAAAKDLAVPGDWLQDRRALRELLPSRARRFTDSWAASSLIRCEGATFARADLPTVRRAILQLAATGGRVDESEVRTIVAGTDYRVQLIHYEGASEIDFVYCSEIAASALRAHVRAHRLLAPFASLIDALGAAELVTTSRADGGSDVKVQFALDERRLASADRWLRAHRFKGSREKGWLRGRPRKGPRALVEASRDGMREVVVLFVYEPSRS